MGSRNLLYTLGGFGQGFLPDTPNPGNAADAPLAATVGQMLTANAAPVSTILNAMPAQRAAALRRIVEVAGAAGLRLSPSTDPEPPRRPSQPPPGFHEVVVRALMQAGLSLSPDWVPFVTTLDLSLPLNADDERRQASIKDLRPLAQLTALRRLDLSRTQVSDIAPLSQLTALQRLYLTGTNVSDIAPLAQLTALQRLYLTGTPIIDIAPLEKLTALRVLGLSGTKVIDITPLGNLFDLETLYLSRTAVSDIAPLARLPHLRRLDLDSTNVYDFRTLTSKNLILNGQYFTGEVAPGRHSLSIRYTTRRPGH